MLSITNIQIVNFALDKVKTYFNGFHPSSEIMYVDTNKIYYLRYQK